jgi:hypothetical protein
MNPVSVFRYSFPDINSRHRWVTIRDLYGTPFLFSVDFNNFYRFDIESHHLSIQPVLLFSSIYKGV